MEIFIILIHLVQDYLYFVVGERIFLQEDGVAMGVYHALSLSNLYLLFSEFSYYIDHGNVDSRGRFIDNGFVPYIGEYDGLRPFLSTLLSYYPRNLAVNLEVSPTTCDVHTFISARSLDTYNFDYLVNLTGNILI